MEDSKINHVSDTALWVGVYRDQETQKPNGLFKDRYASKLVGERARNIEKTMSYSKYVYHSVVIRTCIIDSYLERLISEGADMVVNLGCGIDTRPYRMNLPANLKWIEVDFPHMIKMKEECLANEKSQCQLERVSLDLSNISERQSLFTRINSEGKNIIILTEGVTPYLTEEAVGSLADDLSKQNHFRY